MDVLPPSRHSQLHFPSYNWARSLCPRLGEATSLISPSLLGPLQTTLGKLLQSKPSARQHSSRIVLVSLQSVISYLHICLQGSTRYPSMSQDAATQPGPKDGLFFLTILMNMRNKPDVTCPFPFTLTLPFPPLSPSLCLSPPHPSGSAYCHSQHSR
jgi:hypothetical protein